MNYIKIFTLLFVLSTFLVACGDDDLRREDQLEIDIEKIQDYLSDNGLTAQSTGSGLHYIIEEEGTGGHPTLNDDVKVHYKGYFLDGEVFDETGAAPAEFPLANLIEGWKEGIPLFEKGGKGVLLLPSELGYGKNPPPSIPANSVLVFDIELVDF